MDQQERLALEYLSAELATNETRIHDPLKAVTDRRRQKHWERLKCGTPGAFRDFGAQKW